MSTIEIDDSDELYRRLAPDHVAADGRSVRRNAFRVNTGYPRQISVDLKRLTTSPRDVLQTRPTFGLGVLRVSDVRALGFDVRYDPTPGNPAHCLIEGDNSRETADRLASVTRIVIPPKVS
jgi:hypothetical protein